MEKPTCRRVALAVICVLATVLLQYRGIAEAQGATSTQGNCKMLGSECDNFDASKSCCSPSYCGIDESDAQPKLVCKNCKDKVGDECFHLVNGDTCCEGLTCVKNEEQSNFIPGKATCMKKRDCKAEAQGTTTQGNCKMVGSTCVDEDDQQKCCPRSYCKTDVPDRTCPVCTSCKDEVGEKCNLDDKNSCCKGLTCLKNDEEGTSGTCFKKRECKQQFEGCTFSKKCCPGHFCRLLLLQFFLGSGSGKQSPICIPCGRGGSKCFNEVRDSCCSGYYCDKASQCKPCVLFKGWTCDPKDKPCCDGLKCNPYLIRPSNDIPVLGAARDFMRKTFGRYDGYRCS